MPLKAALRFFVFALIVVAFYFLIIRDHRTSSRSGDHPGSRDNQPSFGRGSSPRSRRPDTRKHSGEPAPEGTIAAEVTCSSQYFSAWRQPANGSCRVRLSGNLPVPDPQCTPGGVNPSVTVDVLRSPDWRTRSIRNCESSEAQKHVAYGWYDILKPRINSNQNQVCELDHLVPLELGGADGLGNIWPECGPDAVTLIERYFKQKDRVENYLAEQVKSGRMDLSTAQRGIAADWTQYLSAATRWCQDSRGC